MKPTALTLPATPSPRAGRAVWRRRRRPCLPSDRAQARRRHLPRRRGDRRLPLARGRQFAGCEGVGGRAEQATRALPRRHRAASRHRQARRRVAAAQAIRRYSFEFRHHLFALKDRRRPTRRCWSSCRPTPTQEGARVLDPNVLDKSGQPRSTSTRPRTTASASWSRCRSRQRGRHGLRLRRRHAQAPAGRHPGVTADGRRQRRMGARHERLLLHALPAERASGPRPTGTSTRRSGSISWARR